MASGDKLRRAGEADHVECAVVLFVEMIVTGQDVTKTQRGTSASAYVFRMLTWPVASIALTCLIIFM